MGTVPKPPVKSARVRRVAAASAASPASPLPILNPTGEQPAIPTGNTPASSAGVKPAPAAKPAPLVTAFVPTPAPVPPAPVAAVLATTIPEPAADAPVAPAAPIAAKEVTMETNENVTNAQNNAQNAFNQATEHTKGAVEKSQKLFADANEFGKGNIEALVESSKIAARGLETLGQEAAAFAKKSFEEATAVAKTLSSVKSPTELMKLQSDYVRSAFEAMVQQTSHNTEALLKLAGEVAQPLSNRAALATEKMKVVS
jgi:phasin family protein